MSMNRGRKGRGGGGSTTSSYSMPRITRTPGGVPPDRIIVVDGVYNNVHFMHAATAQVGNVVRITTASGAVWEGVFKTFSSNFDVVVEVAARVDNVDMEGCGGTLLPETLVDKLIFRSYDILTMTARDVDLNYPVGSTFQTDVEISSKVNGSGALGVGGMMLEGRELEPWDASGGGASIASTAINGEACLELETTANGWDADDMFRKNEEDYGVTSTYDHSLRDYTVQLHQVDSTDYREAEAKATQIAQEIENQPQHKTHLDVEDGDEEAAFAAVVRSGGTTTSVVPISSSHAEKYIPPAKRKIQSVGRLVRTNPTPPPAVTTSTTSISTGSTTGKAASAATTGTISCTSGGLTTATMITTVASSSSTTQSVVSASSPSPHQSFTPSTYVPNRASSHYHHQPHHHHHQLPPSAHHDQQHSAHYNNMSGAGGTNGNRKSLNGADNKQQLQHVSVQMGAARVGRNVNSTSSGSTVFYHNNSHFNSHNVRNHPISTSPSSATASSSGASVPPAPGARQYHHSNQYHHTASHYHQPHHSRNNTVSSESSSTTKELRRFSQDFKLAPSSGGTTGRVSTGTVVAPASPPASTSTTSVQTMNNDSGAPSSTITVPQVPPPQPSTSSSSPSQHQRQSAVAKTPTPLSPPDEPLPSEKTPPSASVAAAVLKPFKLNPLAKEFVLNPAAKPFQPRSPSNLSSLSRPHTPQTPTHSAYMPVSFGGQPGAPQPPHMSMAVPFMVAASGPQPGQYQFQPAQGQRLLPMGQMRADVTSQMQVAAATGQPLMAPAPLQQFVYTTSGLNHQGYPTHFRMYDPASAAQIQYIHQAAAPPPPQLSSQPPPPPSNTPSPAQQPPQHQYGGPPTTVVTAAPSNTNNGQPPPPLVSTPNQQQYHVAAAAAGGVVPQGHHHAAAAAHHQFPVMCPIIPAHQPHMLPQGMQYMQAQQQVAPPPPGAVPQLQQHHIPVLLPPPPHGHHHQAAAVGGGGRQPPPPPNASNQQ